MILLGLVQNQLLSLDMDTLMITFIIGVLHLTCFTLSENLLRPKCALKSVLKLLKIIGKQLDIIMILSFYKRRKT